MEYPASFPRAAHSVAGCGRAQFHAGGVAVRAEALPLEDEVPGAFPAVTPEQFLGSENRGELDVAAGPAAEAAVELDDRPVCAEAEESATDAVDAIVRARSAASFSVTDAELVASAAEPELSVPVAD